MNIDTINASTNITRHICPVISIDNYRILLYFIIGSKNTTHFCALCRVFFLRGVLYAELLETCIHCVLKGEKALKQTSIYRCIFPNQGKEPISTRTCIQGFTTMYCIRRSFPYFKHTCGHEVWKWAMAHAPFIVTAQHGFRPSRAVFSFRKRPRPGPASLLINS